MIADVRQHLEAVPFVPFYIVMSGGQRYHVPTPDHAGVGPRGRMVVWFDDGSGVMLAGLHIVGLEPGAAKKNGGS